MGIQDTQFLQIFRGLSGVFSSLLCWQRPFGAVSPRVRAQMSRFLRSAVPPSRATGAISWSGKAKHEPRRPPFMTEGSDAWAIGGQDRSGEAQNLALFGPVERQVLPLSQPARGEFRRLLAFQDPKACRPVGPGGTKLWVTDRHWP